MCSVALRPLCIFPTKSKPDNRRCGRNTDHPTHAAYTHAVVSGFTAFAGTTMLRATCETTLRPRTVVRKKRSDAFRCVHNRNIFLVPTYFSLSEIAYQSHKHGLEALSAQRPRTRGGQNQFRLPNPPYMLAI